VVRRRRLARAALAPSPGERILDVGCGPGFYCAELLAEVGDGGSVVGVDSSPSMLALAARRCEGRGDVAFAEGDAQAVPVADEDFDAAITVQVMEYVPDVAGALRELLRALRPGGRVVVWDIDWSTWSLHVDDSERAARVRRAWDEHLVHPTLPRTLGAHLRAAGFEDVRTTAHPFVATSFDSEAFGPALLPFIASFVRGRGGVTDDEADAWLAEQRALAERGEFFFAVTQFCFAAAKPRSS
jgi:ubiquinone/menaquinone biosynthesis C-methylase UbiE